MVKNEINGTLFPNTTTIKQNVKTLALDSIQTDLSTKITDLYNAISVINKQLVGV